MVREGRFVIWYEVLDNIGVNNMGERDVGEIVKDSEGFRMNYGREEIRD